MLDLIRQSLSQFTPAERRIAEAILDTPSTAITWSITDAARIAKVSEPSIIRFCRRLDCDGFPDFRLKLAQQLAVRQAPASTAESGADPFTGLVDDVFNRAAESLREARHDLDLDSLRRAVDLLAGARRIDVYGYGGSGFLAGEAQHRLASLGIASVAYADPTLQMVSAPRLTAQDVLFVLSFSGRTSYLIANMEIAKKAGARILSISPGGSVVASLAEENINLNAYRASGHPLIVPTGRAPMYVMLDVLFALLARKREAGPPA
ncbi:MurR/RpiR family transcriptional regulator [Shinella yambaruensis]|uniref:Transcriptional regulator n=1 Tax=Shinella yambaruensis TaxID=415996 RepID=A0ABQ5ZHR6_9HYPH|nr:MULTISPECIES: MurR/RpiR family transcriptional regulator [Shinella]MCJ8024859.1 MurR/RpiR family transcriptional regulator [Shinella yambaruensis]MCU7979312.1 MurR/RpiR family transcriptional regulator [Shinella yambaruensis]MCW5707715.1 MurR/RpiR family transcriptional regulator [Shinella sp.]GLR51140.1 transcriptional regulator [Shinella yambaruensis]